MSCCICLAEGAQVHYTWGHPVLQVRVCVYVCVRVRHTQCVCAYVLVLNILFMVCMHDLPGPKLHLLLK